LLAFYGAAMVASTIFRLANPKSVPIGDKRFANVGVRLSYFDSDPTSKKQVLLLIHGSPGPSDVVRGLARLLQDDFRIIAPDLPGFGASEHDVPNYSFEAHAHYVLALLNKLGLKHVHAAGFSMGGGVVLNLERIAPQRLCSLEMISALGVQEEELTGNYGVNHALHGLQLIAIYGAKHALPHFGLLDAEGLNVEYARNFYDSDQRPLRSVLQHYRGPMLILHGEHDWNVPISAAREHHRLVPQSKLVIVDSNHFMIFQRPELVAGPLKEFLGGLTNSCGG
jgi:pimeloyl-ACP methyl ester carboxylesterase